MRRLDAGSLSGARPGVAVPGYDRRRARTGIVHIGVGGFHRAHEAVYLDELLSRGGSDDWAVCGVGLLPRDRHMKEVLEAQDHLYTVGLKHPDGTLTARVVGALTDYLFLPDDPERVLARMSSPQTHVVSLTITEGGYALDPSTGAFDPSSPDLQHDLEPGAAPRSVFGLLTQALARRRDAGAPPFTVLSCDNIEGNGHAARASLTAFARLVDPALADWIEDRVCFPSSMVDRITPATTDEDRDAVAEATGLRDEWPVVCEPFIQWALEDSFCDGRPSWEDVGVEMVADVRPYERMKLRVLNAGHQALGYLGWLMGHRWVHEAAQDPVLVRLLEAYTGREAVPSIEPPAGVDLTAYGRTVRERFASPVVRDSLERICADTSDRIPKFLLPVVRDRLAAGGDVRLSALVVAAWARYAEGADEQGRPIEVVDPLRDRLTAAAEAQREDPLAFLRIRTVFGDLADDERFVEAYTRALTGLHEVGARRTVEDVLSELA